MAVSVVIITGISGSGLSSALKAFEDMGYFAADNVPVQLIPTFVRLCAQTGDVQRTAFVIDARSREFLGDFPKIHEELLRQGISVTVLFLEADDEVLRRRYSETRRPHPLPDQDVAVAIHQERELLSQIRELADVMIDSSEHTVHTLRDAIRDRFAEKGAAQTMNVKLVSFGYRHGLPREADVLFDVRFLPNPHFIPELRKLTGLDQPVIDYLEKSGEVLEAISRFADLLAYLLPKFEREGKSYLTIGIGCTGGRHRSVMVAAALKSKLTDLGHKVSVIHRDIEREPERYRI
ncbi:MAG TPA: RNase adapter RapZ [Blastocatellia bacterium]|nr:RNase adapter RapZ [Blastocatellia bacterium]